MTLDWILGLALFGTAPATGSAFPALAAQYPIRIALHDGDEILRRALDSDWYRRIESDPALAGALSQPDLKRGLTGLRFLAGALQTDVEGMATRLLDRTIAVYVDPTAPGGSGDAPRILIAVDLGEEATATRWLEVLDRAAVLIGATDDAITEGEVRSIDGKEFHAAAGSWIVASNDRAALEAARTALDGTEPKAARDGTPRLVFEVDLARLRGPGTATESSRTENGLGALIGFGLDAAARTANRVEGSFELATDAMNGRVELHHPPLDATQSAYSWYCHDQGTSPPGLRPEGFVASLRVDRDFAAFYRAKETWLAEESENAFVQFDNGMNLFFGGRSFADEILPAIGSGALLLLTRGRFDDLPAPPAIALPAFTLVAPVDAARLSETELATAFQNTLAIVNLDRAGKGGDSLLAGSSRIGETTVYEARFPRPKDTDVPPGLHFNFAPALALAHDHLVIGSRQNGVAATIEALDRCEGSEVARPALTELTIDVAAAGRALADNRAALVESRMLKEGEDRATAERAVDILLSALAACDRLRITLGLAEHGHALDLSLTFPHRVAR